MIELAEHTKQEVTQRLQDYMMKEHDLELGKFEAEFLMDFFVRELGGYFYNQALADVHSLMQQQFENLADQIYQLAKPVAD